MSTILSLNILYEGFLKDMKIQTVLEQTPVFQTKQYSKPFGSPNPVRNTSLDNGVPEKSGVRAGMFNQVKPHPKEPARVIKRSKQPVDDKKSSYRGDLFYEFVKFLSENDGFSNSHFPRVFNVKTIKDRDGKKVFKYDVEKLNEITDLSANQLAYVSKNILGSTFDSPKDFAFALAQLIADYVNKGKRSSLDAIKNKSVRTAVELIREFVREFNMEIDYGSSDRQAIADRSWANIMLRSTGESPTIVLADPVSYKKI